MLRAQQKSQPPSIVVYENKRFRCNICGTNKRSQDGLYDQGNNHCNTHNHVGNKAHFTKFREMVTGQLPLEGDYEQWTMGNNHGCGRAFKTKQHKQRAATAVARGTSRKRPAEHAPPPGAPPCPPPGMPPSFFMPPPGTPPARMTPPPRMMSPGVVPTMHAPNALRPTPPPAGGMQPSPPFFTSPPPKPPGLPPFAASFTPLTMPLQMHQSYFAGTPSPSVPQSAMPLPTPMQVTQPEEDYWEARAARLAQSDSPLLSPNSDELLDVEAVLVVEAPAAVSTASISP